MEQPAATSAPRRALGWIADAWLVVGLVLLLLVALEYGFRGYRALNRLAHGAPAATVDSSLHPYAGTAWFPAFQGVEGLGARRNRFDPYRSHWPAPVRTRYVNIDALGRRLTVQPPFDPRTARRVFMLGGSVLWGYTARDSFSIPSLTAAALHSHGVANVEVVNLGQAAYNATQEAATLMVELARGRVPDLAVFLDGYNDVATAFKYNEAGHSYGEDGIQQMVDLGGRGFWAELVGLGRHSQLVQRLREALRPRREPPRPPVAEVCRSVAAYYHDLHRVTAGLGRDFGFPTVVLLQPMLETSGKRLTRWERSLPRSEGVPVCAAAIDSAMAARRGRDYFSLSALFDGDTASVFIDNHGHVTEAGNRAIAVTIADRVAPLLAGAATRR